MKSLTEILLAVYSLFIITSSVGLSRQIPVLLVLINVILAFLLAIGLIKNKVKLIMLNILGILAITLLSEIIVKDTLTPRYFFTRMIFSGIMLVCSYIFLRKTSA